jgi:CubicO group peptidase (beta-lactamase class C family)
MKKIIRLTETDLARIVKRVINEQNATTQEALNKMVAENQALITPAVGLKFDGVNGGQFPITSARFGSTTSAILSVSFGIEKMQITYYFYPDPKDRTIIYISNYNNDTGKTTISYDSISKIFKSRGVNIDGDNSKKSLNSLLSIIQNVANKYVSSGIQQV